MLLDFLRTNEHDFSIEGTQHPIILYADQKSDLFLYKKINQITRLIKSQKNYANETMKHFS